MSELRRLSSPLIKEVRGEGLMIGLEVAGNRDDILKGLQRERILAIPAGESVVRFLPAYIFEKEHVDAVVAGLGTVLAAAAEKG